LEEKGTVEDKIFSVAKELGVDLMTEEELWDFTQNIEKTYQNPF